LIIDTKYKKIASRSDLKRDDKYQMFVYGVNFRIKDTMLLYPKHLVDIEDSLELGKGKDLITLRMKSLNLDFCGGYDGFICEIKRRLEEMR
jgi:5-methylcytosine-specific restriction enzyme subunit McrC